MRHGLGIGERSTRLSVVWSTLSDRLTRTPVSRVPWNHQGPIGESPGHQRETHAAPKAMGRKSCPVSLLEVPLVTRNKRLRGGCVICGRRHWFGQSRRNDNCRKMRRVYSACLTARGINPREAASTKHETPTLPGIEASTAPYQGHLIGRAARAQFDTFDRQ
jgi:hypothetical protein